MKFSSNNNEAQCNTLDRQFLAIADAAMLIVLLSLLVFPTWRRGGTIREYITPYLGIAVIAFFIFLLTPYLRRTSHRHGCSLVEERIKGILRDPIFYIGVLFLLLLYIQWLNSGKVYILEDKAREVMFSPPHIDWLPGAVNTLKSRDMLVWFFPVFTALSIVRHGFLKTRMIIVVFWFMILNAAFLAILGLIAPVLLKKQLMWLNSIFILPHHLKSSFSTFGYSNHAASFFLLHLGLTCGLYFYYYSNRKQQRRIMLKTGILLMIILLLFYALHRSHSSYGMIFSWMIMAFFVFYRMYLPIRENRDRKVKPGFIAIVVILLLLVGSFGLYLTAKGDIHSELSTMNKPWEYIKTQLDVRFWYISSAVDIWRHNPIFGIGGGGFGEYLLYYYRPSGKKYTRIHALGKANVHNDFVQFLCEFGIIGVGLLTAAMVVLAMGIFRTSEWKRGFVLFGLLGMAGILLQESFDLPFRNLSVIISFVVILAGYGILHHRRQNRDAPLKKNSFTTFVTRLVNFYTILFLFIIVVVWWILTPVRQDVSKDIVRRVEKLYYDRLLIPRYDKVTPGKSLNASPAMLGSLRPAKMLYGKYKDLHLLSAKINFDLYRKSKSNNEKNARKYLLAAFQSSLIARRFTTCKDIDFINIHTAILDELGYYLEESLCLKALSESYPDDIRINLLVREYYIRRPNLIW